MYRRSLFSVVAWRRVLIAVAVCALPGYSLAAELLEVKVERVGKRYTVHSVSRYQASRDSLMHILLDYENFDQVSSVFKESRYLEPAPDGARRAYTRVEGCVLFFCKSIERIDRVSVAGDDTIVAEAESEPADFRYSRGQWQFRSTSEGEHIVYDLEMEPGFWMPPVIGPYILKRRLTAGAVDAMGRVEQLAQERDESRLREPVRDGDSAAQ